jgi:hypothetical protein
MLKNLFQREAPPAPRRTLIEARNGFGASHRGYRSPKIIHALRQLAISIRGVGSRLFSLCVLRDGAEQQYGAP